MEKHSKFDKNFLLVNQVFNRFILLLYAYKNVSYYNTYYTIL